MSTVLPVGVEPAYDPLVARPDALPLSDSRLVIAKATKLW